MTSGIGDAATKRKGSTVPEVALDSAQPLAAGLATIFVVFTVFNLLELPAGIRLFVVLHDLLIVATTFVVWSTARRGVLTTTHVYPALALVAALVASNPIVVLGLRQMPFYSIYVVMVVIGSGILLLSRAWLGATLAVIVLGWAAVAAQVMAADTLMHHCFALGAAVVTSLAVQSARLRTLRRLQEIAELERRSRADRHLLENRLTETQRNATLAALAGGVAHEMNSVLGSVVANATVLQQDLPADDSRQEPLDGILAAASRGASMVANLLSLTRPSTDDRRDRISMNAAVEATAVLLDRTVSRNISVEVDCADELRMVDVDPDRCCEALMGICLNGVQAMPDGGTLRVATKNRTIGPGGLPRIPQLAPGAYAEIEVVDTGVGMVAELVRRAFEPHFTTKQTGSGTGICLSTARAIIEEHGGAVDLESAPGRGTRVRILLPAAEGRAPRAPRRLKPVGERMAVVIDDDAQIRDVCERMLGKLGWRVATAKNGREGLERVRAANGAVDLVVLDMVMPEMDGSQCYATLRSFDPDLPVVVISGYVAGRDTGAIHRDSRAVFLAKPFSFADLATAIDTTVGTASV